MRRVLSNLVATNTTIANMTESPDVQVDHMEETYQIKKENGLCPAESEDSNGSVQNDHMTDISSSCKDISISDTQPDKYQFRVNLNHIDEINNNNNDMFASTQCNQFKINDFTNIVPMAEGTHAILYHAYAGSREVVIKMIKKNSVQNKIAIQEFEHEQSILEHISHPHIVQYLGSGRHPRHFIVLEYFSEGTLGDLFSDMHHRRRSTGDTRDVTINMKVILYRARELADALHYLHCLCVPGVSIIHRDLKPDNIAISQGVIKLFDFGLSTCVKQRTSLDEAYEMTGCTGSLRYMAPEVALNQAYTEKIDVYSYGVILWQMATGITPLNKSSKQEFLHTVIDNNERPPLKETWPKGFRDLLESCWCKDPLSRPSFAMILCMLDAFLSFECKTDRQVN